MKIEIIILSKFLKFMVTKTKLYNIYLLHGLIKDPLLKEKKLQDFTYIAHIS